MHIVKDPKKAKTCHHTGYRGTDMVCCGKPGVARTARGCLCLEHVEYILGCIDEYEFRDEGGKVIDTSAVRFLERLREKAK